MSWKESSESQCNLVKLLLNGINSVKNLLSNLCCSYLWPGDNNKTSNTVTSTEVWNPHVALFGMWDLLIPNKSAWKFALSLPHWSDIWWSLQKLTLPTLWLSGKPDEGRGCTRPQQSEVYCCTFIWVVDPSNEQGLCESMTGAPQAPLRQGDTPERFSSRGLVWPEKDVKHRNAPP